VFGGSAMIVG